MLATIMSQKDIIRKKLNQAEKELNYKFSENIYDFILNLKEVEVEFGEDIWCFNILIDSSNEENYIIKSSNYFIKEWKVKGIVIAENYGGDELVLLENQICDSEEIFVTIHETAEIKLFSQNVNELLKYGPLDYYFDQKFIIKLDENENPVFNKNYRISPIDNEILDDRELKSKTDDLIDDSRFDKQIEILENLEKLTLSEEKEIKIWAFNKLSELYFIGFGDLKVDTVKALKNNEKAMNLNSYKAFASFAYCLLVGYGIEKNLEKSLEYAIKANELSKTNKYSKIISTKKNGGLYENLITRIENEINNCC